MRKPVVLLCVMALGVGLLAGCGTPDVATNTIIVEKNGKVTEALVEDFSKEYYSQEELEAFVESEIEEYKSENADADIKMSDLSVEAGTARMTIKYGDAETYRDFHQVNFFVGSVVDAQTAGYKFEGNFVAVTDGVAGDSLVGTSTVLEGEGKVVIIQDAIEVQVPGTIKYVSEGVTVNSEDTAAITVVNETDVAPVAYIIYE